MEKKQIKVGIIGLGLIGGSILKKLSSLNSYEIFVASNSSYKDAEKYTKNSSNDLNIIKNCDIIFLCSKASQTLDYLNKLNNLLDKKAIVVDVCSIKNSLLNKKYNFDFILSHPMAGIENSGFSSSFEDLFVDNKWLIEKNNKVLEKIIKDLGAIPIKIDMKNHDFLCAQISHLPTLISFLLFESAKDEAKLIASSGFRDTTRLAMTNSDLILSMLKENSTNIDEALNVLINNLNNLKKLSNNEKIKLFEDIAMKRKQMYDKNGKNIFKI